jgi:hypothetical protein
MKTQHDQFDVLFFLKPPKTQSLPHLLYFELMHGPGMERFVGICRRCDEEEASVPVDRHRAGHRKRDRP